MELQPFPWLVSWQIVGTSCQFVTSNRPLSWCQLAKECSGSMHLNSLQWSMVTSFECFGSVTSLLSIHLSHTARPLLFIWSCEWSKEGLCTSGAREGTCVFLVTFWLQQMMSTKSNDGSSHWCDSLFSPAVVSWKSCHKPLLTIIFVWYLTISNSWAAEFIEDLMLDFFYWCVEDAA